MNRDAIDSKLEPVGSHEAGKLYRLGILDVVVLNGTSKEMGRQYGTLMKDKILTIGARGLQTIGGA